VVFHSKGRLIALPTVTTLFCKCFIFHPSLFLAYLSGAPLLAFFHNCRTRLELKSELAHNDSVLIIPAKSFKVDAHGVISILF
jgi:hypothetical protein